MKFSTYFPSDNYVQRFYPGDVTFILRPTSINADTVLQCGMQSTVKLDVPTQRNQFLRPCPRPLLEGRQRRSHLHLLGVAEAAG